MAEYRALAQNTYKFVTERILQYAGDIGTPNAPQFSKVKALVDGELMYLSLIPVNEITAESETLLQCNNKSDVISWNGSTNHPRGYGNARHIQGSVIIENKKYYGTHNAHYACFSKVTRVSVLSERYTLDETVIIPKGIIKTVKYSASEGTIVAEEKEFIQGKLVPVEAYSTSSTSPKMAWQEAIFKIAKSSEDIIMAISVEYPKYNITLSGTGMQYSIDDGVTFQDVTEDIALEQVEHIVFKNTDTVTHNIGTAEGGTDVANIASGATYVAIPTTDGTWHIS